MTAKEPDKPASASRSSHSSDRTARNAGRPPTRSAGAERAQLGGLSLDDAELWQRTFDAVPDLLAILDNEYRIVRVNRALADRLGLEIDQCIGHTCYSCIHGADEPPSSCPHRQMLNDGRPHAAEVRSEGLQGDFLMSASPLRDSAGRIIGSVHVARDVTEERKTASALVGSEAKYRAVVETAQEGLGIIDADNNIVFVNRAFSDMLGYEQDELLRLSLGVIANESEFAKFHSEPRNRPDHKRSRCETVLRRKNGEVRHVAVSTSPLFDDREAFIGTLALVTDITEQIRAQQDIKRLNAELEERVRRRTAQLAESEDRYRRLFQESTDVILVHEIGPGGPGRIVDVNDVAVRLLGYSRGELLRMSPLDLETPDCRQQVPQMAERLQAGETMVFERLAVASDGRKIPVEIRSKVIQWKGDFRVLTQARDITERKHAEEALRESEEKFRTLAEQSPNMIFINKKGRVVYANKKCEEDMGYTRKEFYAPDFDFLTLVSPECVEIVKASFGRHQKGLHVDPYEYALISRDGKRIEALITTEMIEYEGENSVLGIVTDITERKRAENALRERERQQAEVERMAATGRMAARVAHEINNPLAGIKNAFRLIRGAVPDDHPDHDMVGRIDREIDRIANIVEQMYSLYSPRASRASEVRVDEAIRDMLAMLEPLRREYQVQFDATGVRPGLTAVVSEGGLYQILYNLTTNAVEASSPQGVVTISAEVADARTDFVQITVHDQGGGIPSDLRSRIFEPFFSSKTDEHSLKGLGIGLSVVKSSVEAAGGTIELESVPGQGTTFHVYIPSTPKPSSEK